MLDLLSARLTICCLSLFPPLRTVMRCNIATFLAILAVAATAMSAPVNNVFQRSELDRRFAEVVDRVYARGVHDGLLEARRGLDPYVVVISSIDVSVSNSYNYTVDLNDAICILSAVRLLPLAADRRPPHPSTMLLRTRRRAPEDNPLIPRL